MATMEERMKLIEGGSLQTVVKERLDLIDERLRGHSEWLGKIDVSLTKIATNARESFVRANNRIDACVSADEAISKTLGEVRSDANRYATRIAGIVTGQDCAGHAHANLDARIGAVEVACDACVTHRDPDINSDPPHPATPYVAAGATRPRTHFDPTAVTLSGLRNLVPDDSLIAVEVDRLRRVETVLNGMPTHIDRVVTDDSTVYDLTKSLPPDAPLARELQQLRIDAASLASIKAIAKE